MEKTREKLSVYWDRIISKAIPHHTKFSDFEKELKEHFNFIDWAFKRIILPILIFYIGASLILKTNIFGPIFTFLIIFLYSNFLPDIDFLIRKTSNKKTESLWYDRYFFLFFAPIVIYYIIGGRAKPLYSTKERSFHNLKTAFIYGIFLFILGTIFWQETHTRITLPILGMLGFILHLAVDKKIAFVSHE